MQQVLERTKRKVVLSRDQEGFISATLICPLMTFSSMRHFAHRMHNFLASSEAVALACTAAHVPDGRSFTVILNPQKKPDEMQKRLENFKSALIMIVGSDEIVADFKSLN